MSCEARFAERDTDVRAFLKMRPYFRPITDKLTSMPLTDLRILDLGCCRTCVDLSVMNALGVGESVGIDREDLAKATKPSNSDLVLADACSANLPFTSESFDAVIMDEVVEHLDDPLRTLKECARILRPGGFLAVTTPNHANLKNRMKLLMGESAYVPLEVWLVTGRNVKNNGTYFLGHIREYTGREIVAMMSLAGLEVCSLEYFPATRKPDILLVGETDVGRSLSNNRIEKLGQSGFLFFVYGLVERLLPSLRYNMTILASRKKGI